MLLVVSKAAKPSQADFASKCIPPTSDKLGEVQAKVDRKSKNYNALQAPLIMALALPLNLILAIALTLTRTLILTLTLTLTRRWARRSPRSAGSWSRRRRARTWPTAGRAALTT